MAGEELHANSLEFDLVHTRAKFSDCGATMTGGLISTVLVPGRTMQHSSQFQIDIITFAD
jgi:hypothetical protein